MIAEVAGQVREADRAASRSTDKGPIDEVPVLRQSGQPGEGQPPVGRRRGHPSSPVLSRLQRAVHDLRAGAAARADDPEAQRPAHAVRPRQAGPLAGRSPCASGRSSPNRSSRWSRGIVRQLESLGETEIPSSVVGDFIMKALKGVDEVAYVRYASVYKDFRAHGRLRPVPRRRRSGRRPGPRSADATRSPEARHVAGRAHRHRDGRKPVDHRPRRASRVTACAPRTTPSWSASRRCWPTIPT